MDILKFLKAIAIVILLIFFTGCHDYNREVKIGNAIFISDWNINSFPQKAILYLYKKDNKFKDIEAEYKSALVSFENDTLNKRKLLKIVFDTDEADLTTGFDYRVSIDNTIEYKIHDLKVSPKNQGSEIYGKVGDKMMSADEKGIYLETEK